MVNSGSSFLVSILLCFSCTVSLHLQEEECTECSGCSDGLETAWDLSWKLRMGSLQGWLLVGERFGAGGCQGYHGIPFKGEPFGAGVVQPVEESSGLHCCWQCWPFREDMASDGKCMKYWRIVCRLSWRNEESRDASKIWFYFAASRFLHFPASLSAHNESD